MIENITCPTCGHVYPWQVPRSMCRYCKTEFTRGTCYVCREYKDHIRHGKCRECSNEINSRSSKRQAANAAQEYAEWVNKITSVPKPLKTLTEDDWLYACSYFNGCAICGEDTIDARVLFVPGHRGGTYTMYNVIPACEKCATAHNQTAAYKNNPFSALYGKYTRANRERLETLKKYLQERLVEYDKRNSI